MWSWDSFVSTFHVAVDLVQDVISPCWKAYMLMVLRKNSSEVAVVVVPCCDEYSVRLFGLDLLMASCSWLRALAVSARGGM